jgi:hypothetical protein
MTYTRPGIYVSEGPFTTQIASSPSTSAAAFVGTAERGPSSPALIQSWNSYKTQFGDLDVTYEMGYSLYHFFANGGRTAYVTRVISGASTSVAAFANFTGTVATVGGTVFKLSAPSIEVPEESKPANLPSYFQNPSMQDESSRKPYL